MSLAHLDYVRQIKRESELILLILQFDDSFSLN